jgi:hypothetical protein
MSDVMQSAFTDGRKIDNVRILNFEFVPVGVCL